MGLAELTRSQETILWSKAAGRCSKCKVILVKKGKEEFFKKGENAHIEGKEPKAARHNYTQSRLPLGRAFFPNPFQPYLYFGRQLEKH